MHTATYEQLFFTGPLTPRGLMADDLSRPPLLLNVGPELVWQRRKTAQGRIDAAT